MPTHWPGIPLPWVTPQQTSPPMGRCRECRTPARLDRMVNGLGEKCARDAGLLGPRVDAEQTGPDLFDQLDEEDLCDGWDR